jgi:hypothetical protein
MAVPGYNPNIHMNNMMMTNHIMNHFKSRSNVSITESLMSQEFINETTLMFIQIIAISLFTGVTAYFSSSFDFLINRFKRFHLFSWQSIRRSRQTRPSIFSEM